MIRVLASVGRDQVASAVSHWHVLVCVFVRVFVCFLIRPFATNSLKSFAVCMARRNGPAKRTRFLFRDDGMPILDLALLVLTYTFLFTRIGSCGRK